MIPTELGPSSDGSDESDFQDDTPRARQNSLMQSIVLNIPSGRSLHEWWHVCTPTQVAEALDIAGSMMSLLRVSELSRTTSEPPRTAAATSERARSGGCATLEDVNDVIANVVPCESVECAEGEISLRTSNDRRILVVVKDAETLRSKTDVDAFYKGIYETRDDEIDGAMFISLRARIPNVPESCSVTKAQTKAGKLVPAIFLCCPPRTAIQVATRSLLALLAMQQPAREAEENADVEREYRAIRQTLPKLCAHLYTSETKLEERIDMLQTLLDDALAERSTLRDTCFALHRLKGNVPWVAADAPQDDVATMDAAIAVLKALSNETASVKTSRMTQSQRQLIKSAGGIKKVTAALARREHQNGGGASQGKDDASPVMQGKGAPPATTDSIRSP